MMFFGRSQVIIRPTRSKLKVKLPGLSFDDSIAEFPASLQDGQPVRDLLKVISVNSGGIGIRLLVIITSCHAFHRWECRFDSTAHSSLEKIGPEAQVCQRPPYTIGRQLQQRREREN